MVLQQVLLRLREVPCHPPLRQRAVQAGVHWDRGPVRSGDDEPHPLSLRISPGVHDAPDRVLRARGGVAVGADDEGLGDGGAGDSTDLGSRRAALSSGRKASSAACFATSFGAVSRMMVRSAK